MARFHSFALVVLWIFASAIQPATANAQSNGGVETEDPPNPFATEGDGDSTSEGDGEGDGDAVPNPFGDPDPPPSDPNQGDGTCVPDCGPGYLCFHGQCTSRCNPDCPAGQRCNASATCEPDPNAACPSGSELDASGLCVARATGPACQAGMVRTPAGTCAPGVVCPPGTIATAGGQCQPTQVTCGLGMVQVNGRCVPARGSQSSSPSVAAGSARSRGALSLVGAALVLGTGIGTGVLHRRGSEGFNPDDCDIAVCYPRATAGPSFALSLLGTGLQFGFGLAGSKGGSRARRAGATTGGALRTIGWVSWAISLAGQLALTATHAAGIPDDAPSVAPTSVLYVTSILGATSLILFGIDALMAANSVVENANRSDEETSSAVRWLPRLLVGPEPGGGGRAELGATALF